MPVSKYYAGHGDEVMANMIREYGAKKGKQVFYATANKRKLASVSPSGGNASETRRKRRERKARKKHIATTSPMYFGDRHDIYRA